MDSRPDGISGNDKLEAIAARPCIRTLVFRTSSLNAVRALCQAGRASCGTHGDVERIADSSTDYHELSATDASSFLFCTHEHLHALVSTALCRRSTCHSLILGRSFLHPSRSRYA